MTFSLFNNAFWFGNCKLRDQPESSVVNVLSLFSFCLASFSSTWPTDSKNVLFSASSMVGRYLGNLNSLFLHFTEFNSKIKCSPFSINDHHYSKESSNCMKRSPSPMNIIRVVLWICFLSPSIHSLTFIPTIHVNGIK